MRRNSSSDETSLKLISNGYHGLSKCYQHTKQNHLVPRLITSTECFLRKTLLVLEKKNFVVSQLTLIIEKKWVLVPTYACLKSKMSKMCTPIRKNPVRTLAHL